MATRDNPYSNLHFAKQADWQHVNPILLAKVNAIAKSKGQIVDIISGYRSPAYNQSVGGAEHSQHTNGNAIDAYIDGTPIGSVWDSSVFQKAGLRSGNQPNFFKGKPDPEHVDFGLDAAPYTGDTSSPPPAQDTVTSYAPPDPTGVNSLAPESGAASIGPTVGANVITPRDTASPFQPNDLPPRFATWQMLSALPGASPATMQMSKLAGYEAPDAGS